MTTEYFPEQTIRYKTYAKSTMVEALNAMFAGHPDELLQRTKATIEYPRTEAAYPCVIVRFFEREVFNAGVGHKEIAYLNGESDSVEISIDMLRGGSVQLSWPAIANAVGYNVYVGTASGQENQMFAVVANSFTDVGAAGTLATVPTLVTASLDTPQPSAVIAPGTMAPGARFYRITAVAPSEAVTYQHYYYHADMEFAIYALSSYDRDLISDTIVQTLAFGHLDAYTNQFFNRVYPINEQYPDSNLHFINVNSDRIQGFGETQVQTPWGAEDDLLYLTAYRFGVFGELFSLPPKLTYAMVQKVILYPLQQGFSPIPAVLTDGANIWVSNGP